VTTELISKPKHRAKLAALETTHSYGSSPPVVSGSYFANATLCARRAMPLWLFSASQPGVSYSSLRFHHRASNASGTAPRSRLCLAVASARFAFCKHRSPVSCCCSAAATNATASALMWPSGRPSKVSVRWWGGSRGLYGDSMDGRSPRGYSRFNPGKRGGFRGAVRLLCGRRVAVARCIM